MGFVITSPFAITPMDSTQSGIPLETTSYGISNRTRKGGAGIPTVLQIDARRVIGIVVFLFSFSQMWI